MNTLIIGGGRHGEWLPDLPDGIGGWVDIRTATTYRVRTLNWVIQDPETGLPSAAYAFRVAVHPDGVGPQEPTVVSELVRMLAMNDFAAAHGERQEMPQEPAVQVPTDHRPPSIN